MSYTHELVAGGLFCAALVLLALLRSRLGTFWSIAAFYVASLAYLAWGFEPAMPASLVNLYAGVALVAILLYATSSEESKRSFFGPIRAVMVENRRLPILVLALLVIPLVVARKTYTVSLPSDAPPPKIRSIHPSPPSTIDFQAPGAEEAVHVDLIAGTNPYRPLETSDPQRYEEILEHGKIVYFENCFFCHGDTLAGDGHYADAFKPVPAKFTAKDTIPMLTETYLFWRVSKGGPGLPDEGTPYDSTMPAWEAFLTEEDIWAVIMYLYEYTGYEPRKADSAGGH